MPTLPMYHPPPQVPEAADASHRIFAPGGYEAWVCDTQTHDARRRLLVGFCLNSPVALGTIRSYRRYLATPTTQRPPMPADHPALVLRLSGFDRQPAAWTSRAEPSALSAAADRLDVRIGAHRLEWTDGALHVQIKPSDVEREARMPEVQLTLRPASQLPLSNRPLHVSDALSPHRWISDCAIYQVEGNIDGEAYAGRGMRLHYYGLRPLGRDVRQWLTVRLLLEDRLMMLHGFWPNGGGSPCWTMIDAHAHGATERALDGAEMTWSRSGLARPAWPMTLRVGDVSLINGRVVDEGPGRLTLCYDWTGMGQTAWADLSSPR